MLNNRNEKKITISLTDVEKKLNIPADVEKKLDVLADVEKKLDVPVEVEKKSLRWGRLLLGTIFVSLGVTATITGVSSIRYRMTHIVVDGGLVNSRSVRLTAPKDGNLKAFYAKPGIKVKSGQVLARIDSQEVPQQQYQEKQLGFQLVRAKNEQVRRKLAQDKLAGEVRSNQAELTAARQSLGFLQNQLKMLENQYRAVQAVDIKLAGETVSEKQAAVKAALARATAARSDYRRFQKLFADGAVSEQRLETLRFASEAAEAQVKEMQATLSSAQAALDGAKRGVALSNQDNLDDSLSLQRSKLRQAIQQQQMRVNTLEAKVGSSTEQLKQSLVLLKDPISAAKIPQKIQSSSQLQVVKAPLSGVVYTTHSEQGEQVSNSQPLLTLLDCNDLWVETVIKADDASRININKPAQVRFSSTKQTFSGEIDIIQPLKNIKSINEQSQGVEVQALSPVIPTNLAGQSLMRVTVRIPQTNAYTQSQRFCGIGQSAQVTFSQQ